MAHEANCNCPTCLTHDMNRHSYETFGFWYDRAGRKVIDRAPVADFTAPTTVDTRPGAHLTARRSRVSVGFPPTEKQLGYLRNLVQKADVSEVTRTAYLELIAADKLTKKTASELITHLKELPKTASGGSRPAQRVEQLELGLYRKGEDTFQVKESRSSGYRYAVRLEGTKWIYARGVAAELTSDMALTLEEAKAYGQRTGVCCACGAELTNPDSIEAGIGPICANKF